MSPPAPSSIIELNVGGVFYTTSLRTLCSDPKSRLCKWFGKVQAAKDGEVVPTGGEEESDTSEDPDCQPLTRDSKAKHAKQMDTDSL